MLAVPQPISGRESSTSGRPTALRRWAHCSGDTHGAEQRAGTPRCCVASISVVKKHSLRRRQPITHTFSRYRKTFNQASGTLPYQQSQGERSQPQGCPTLFQPWTRAADAPQPWLGRMDAAEYPAAPVSPQLHPGSACSPSA